MFLRQWKRFLQSVRNQPASPRISPYLVELSNVVKTYTTSAQPFTAIQDIDVKIKRGEFVSVVGKSGSGKSTLINMIAGIDRPSSGDVLVAGQPIHQLHETALARWRSSTLGIVFQFFQLLPTLTLLENVMLPMEFGKSTSFAQRKARARELLELVGLTDQAHKLPANVSGGQQQRAAIARALANDPPLIVADEPTGNLDTNTAHIILQLFEQLVNEGKTIIMVTHDHDLAMRGSHVIRIDEGRIAAHFFPKPETALSNAQLAPILAQVEQRMVAPGEDIIIAGDISTKFFVLVRGEADVLVQQNGADVAIGKLIRGQHFGETGILRNAPRNATVRAAGTEAVQVAALGSETLFSMLHELELPITSVARLIYHSSNGEPLEERGAPTAAAPNGRPNPWTFSRAGSNPLDRAGRSHAIRQ